MKVLYGDHLSSRRTFIGAFFSFSILQKAVAQTQRRRIAWVTSKISAADASRVAPFLAALKAKGWTEGYNIDII